MQQKKKQLSFAELKVGVLVTVALILLAALILQQNWGMAWFAKSVKAITYLPDVGGLKPGAPVWLAGIEIGKVRKVGIVPPEVYRGNDAVFIQIAELKKQIESVDPRQPSASQMVSDLTDRIRNLKTELRFVEVQLDIRSEYLNRISKDSEVAIESKGLIGDSFIQISAGAFGVPPPKLGDFYLIEGLRTTGFREIMTGANDVIANFGVLSDQIKNIAMKINPDKVGSGLAQTIKDMQSTLRQVEITFGKASLLADDLRKGDGTIGHLVSDPVLYQRLTESVDRLNKIADELQNGNGTLPKMIKDPSIYNHANATLERIENIVTRIDKGEGTLGRLSRDQELYDSAKKTIDRISSILDKMENADGTVGKLLKDPSLYNNLNQSTAEITKLIYDLRQDPKKYLTIRVRLF
jgi:phospholipid/cholesterol/gamma-HCH transport system substrate-binding protein